ncbi:MAG: hypothetical protein ACXWKW_03815, partial [Asticcacaulis sp.]
MGRLFHILNAPAIRGAGSARTSTTQDILMTLTIRQAETPEDYAAFGDLCRDYVNWSRHRYESVPWLVEEVFGYQSLDDELKALHLKYGPPKGRTFLAEKDGSIVAGGAYHRLS